MHSGWNLKRYLSPSMLTAALWTFRARLRARQVVWQDGISVPLILPSSVGTAPTATPAVEAVLARTRATCLVRSLVLQTWLADHGEPVDVVIGVTPPSAGFRAHAWLDRVGETGYEEFVELHRLPAPRRLPVSSGDSAAGGTTR